MNKYLIAILMMVISFPYAIQAASNDGFLIGGTGSVSLKDTNKQDDRFWSIGVSGAYRYGLSSRFYLQPELAIEFTQYKIGDYDFAYPGINNNFKTSYDFFGTHLAFNFGVNLGYGFSFFTGPQVRYTYTGEDKGDYVIHSDSTKSEWEYDFEAYTGLHKNQVSAQWSFGFNKDFGRIYANVRYSQQMTKIKNGHTDQNYFRFSVGYRF